MKIVMWILIAAFLCGCRSAPPADASVVKPMALVKLMPPVVTKQVARTVMSPAIPVTTVRISWTPNYVDDSEQTGILSNSNIEPLCFIPPQGAIIFTGRTNQCTVAVNQQQQFFRAYNFLP